MGLELGENTRATLITRGLAEITRLSIALGGRPDTLSGLSGLGDMMLTATSLTSRNTRFGYELAKGAEAQNLRNTKAVQLSEGAWTAEAALKLASRYGVELPITKTVADVLEGRKTLEQAVTALIARPLPASE